MKSSWENVWAKVDAGMPLPPLLASGNDAAYVESCVHALMEGVGTQHSLHSPSIPFKRVVMTAAAVVKDPDLIPRALAHQPDLFTNLLDGDQGTSPDPMDGMSLHQASAPGATATCVVISHATDKLTKPLSGILDQLSATKNPGKNLLVLWSAKLNRSSSLRRLAETQSSLTFLPTYSPDRGYFRSYTMHLLKRTGGVAQDAPSSIAPHPEAPTDTLIDTLGTVTGWRIEGLPLMIEKMRLYGSWGQDKGDSFTLSPETIWACLAEPQPELESFIQHLLARDTMGIIATSGSALDGTLDGAAGRMPGVEPIPLIHLLTFYFTKLLELHDLRQTSNQPPEKLVYQLKPMLPPTMNAALARGLTMWKPATIRNIIANLNGAEKAQKLQSSPKSALLLSLLMRSVNRS